MIDVPRILLFGLELLLALLAFRAGLLPRLGDIDDYVGGSSNEKWSIAVFDTYYCY